MGRSKAMHVFHLRCTKSKGTALSIAILASEDKSASGSCNDLVDSDGDLPACNAIMLQWLLRLYDDKFTTVKLLVASCNSVGDFSECWT